MYVSPSLLGFGILGHMLTMFIALSADPLLVWNYGSVAVLCAITGSVFWIVFRKLDAEEDKLNNLAQGHLESRKTISEE